MPCIVTKKILISDLGSDIGVVVIIWSFPVILWFNNLGIYNPFITIVCVFFFLLFMKSYFFFVDILILLSMWNSFSYTYILDFSEVGY